MWMFGNLRAVALIEVPRGDKEEATGHEGDDAVDLFELTHVDEQCFSYRQDEEGETEIAEERTSFGQPDPDDDKGLYGPCR